MPRNATKVSPLKFFISNYITCLSISDNNGRRRSEVPNKVINFGEADSRSQLHTCYMTEPKARQENRRFPQSHERNTRSAGH